MLGQLRNRFAAAIEWRVVREVDREREVIRSLEEQINATALEYGNRIMVLEQAIERLHSRLERQGGDA